MNSLLQIRVDKKLKDAIHLKAAENGVPSSNLIRKVLTHIFLEEENLDNLPGNIFNADRDNNGKGISANDFLKILKA